MAAVHHRALSIREILEEIFGYLSGFESPATLARLARTARLFHNPAIVALWRFIPSLMPLLRLLPFRLINSIFFLRSPILPNKWDKFIDRAKLVRQISHPHDYCDRIDDSVFVELRKIAVLRDLPLFPSLQILNWMGTQGCDVFFASPSLEHVTITIYPDDVGAYIKYVGHLNHSQVVQPFLSSLPSVKELRLGGPTALGWLCPINQFKHLRILDLSLATALIDRVFLREVSHFENLAELAVKTSDSVYGEDFMEYENNSGFRSLQKLTITGSARILIDMLKMISTSSSLQDLSISTLLFENWNWNTCFVILGTRFQSSLRKLRLEERLRSAHPHPAISIVEFLHPLLEITLLEEFLFEYDGPSFTMSNDDLAIMSESWTDLRELCLLHVHQSQIPSLLPTFQALLILANNCPCLSSVSITLDHKTPPPQLAVPVTHPLRSLRLGDSFITPASLPSISLFLGTLFPDLIFFGWGQVSDPYTECLWKEVFSSLPGVQKFFEAKSREHSYKTSKLSTSTKKLRRLLSKFLGPFNGP